MMIIAVDGMGGDFAPTSIVEGCVSAVNQYKNIKIIITGSESLIKNELKKFKYDNSRIEVLNANEVIINDEQPVKAIRKKKDSSLNKALYLVRDKKADAIISAGSTGALMAGSIFIIGRIKGIDRPAIAALMPVKNGPTMMIDCGANAECKPINLLQFAIMGNVYFENVLNIQKPKIGLINIGAEEEKGNTLTKGTFKLLKESQLNFVGNVEPRYLPEGNENILVCDGFIGNTILKTYEGVASNIFSVLKEEIMKSFKTKIGGALLKPVFKNFKKNYDYKEYGGAALLGINGICIKAHGSSDAKAIKNAIRESIKFYENNIIEKIKFEIESKNKEN